MTATGTSVAARRRESGILHDHWVASQTGGYTVNMSDQLSRKAMPSGDSGAGVAHVRKVYYRNHFPHEAVCKLLGRAWRGKDMLHFREVAVETHDDVYIRWLSVSSPAELRSILVSKNTCKIHVGAIFDQQPIHRKKVTSIQATQREFVVDIDVNDYVNMGVDSGDLEACDGAWPVVAFGMIIVETIMRERFGFENILMVYSGRRGAHLTVYDARACELTDEARGAMVSYMHPSDKQTEGGRPKYGNIMSDGFFGSLWESHILPFWTNYCLKPRDEGGAGFMDSPLDREEFMQLLGIDHAKRTLNLAALAGVHAWAVVWQYALGSRYKDDTIEKVKHTVLSYVWPRLDANVSKQRNHLNKAWFSLHPKTGRLCVPIMGHPGKFDPSTCPRLDEVVAGNPVHCKAFQAAVAGFSKFVDRLEKSPSEEWTPPRTQMPVPRVYSMVGHKRGRDEECGDGDGYILGHTSRLCYNVQRVFYAMSSTAEPDQVSFMWNTVPTTEDPGESVSKIYAGYSPPYRSPGNFPMHKFLAAVDKATRTPDTEIEIERAYVCVLLHPRNQDTERAVQRFKRMCPGLATPNFSGDVNFKWEDSSKEVVIKSMVKPLWEVKHIFL